MTQTRYICWLNFGRIDKVKCTAETEKYIFTDEFGRLAKSASTHRVRSSMTDACNTMKHYYNGEITDEDIAAIRQKAIQVEKKWKQ